MANTLLTLQQEIADRLNLDYTVTANATRLTRWANFIQQDIASRYPFDWLFARAYIQTVTDQTAGTVNVTNGSATVTGNATAFVASNVNAYIQFSGDTNWYEITVVAGQTLTLSTNYAGTNNAAATYILRTQYYDLPATCFRIMDARISSSSEKLSPTGIWTTDTTQPDINTTGTPTAWYMFRVDPTLASTAAKQQQIGFYPIANSVLNIDVRYFLQPTDLSSTSDITIIPYQYIETLLVGMEWLGNKFINDPSENHLLQSYEYGISRMIAMSNTHGDPIPTLPIFTPDARAGLIPEKSGARNG